MWVCVRGIDQMVPFGTLLAFILNNANPVSPMIRGIL